MQYRQKVTVGNEGRKRCKNKNRIIRSETIRNMGK